MSRQPPPPPLPPAPCPAVPQIRITGKYVGIEVQMPCKVGYLKSREAEQKSKKLLPRSYSAWLGILPTLPRYLPRPP